MQFPLELIATVQPGPYVSAWKILPVIVILLGWAKVLTWIDKDTEAARLPREVVNLGMLGAVIAGFVVVLFVPMYALGLSLFVVLMFGSIGGYFGARKSKVGLEDLKRDYAAWRKGHSKGDKITSPAGPVTFLAKSGAVHPPDSDAEDRPAYDAIQKILGESMLRNAERVDAMPSEEGLQARFVVDGVAYNTPGVDRATGAAAISYIKQLAGLDINEKRKPQTGAVKVMVEGKKHDLEVTTQGSTAGEFLKLVVDPKKRHGWRLEKMSFAPEQLQAIQEAIADNKGIVLVSAPKGHGLTSMLYAVLRGHDAFIQHMQTIERNPDQDVEGITQNKLPANATPAEERKAVEWAISQEPDVLLMNQLEDPGSAKALVDFAHTGDRGKRAYVGMRAGSTFDAMAAWRKIVGDDRAALEDLRLVISGRVMRKLCEACKEAYNPDPETLRKLNMNPASAATLFQERRTPVKNEKGETVPCTFCKELRFNGRFGVYEVLVVDDEIRQAALAGGSSSQLKAAFRKQKGKLLQEMALAAVERGETSVKEMVRVLKGDSGAPEPGAARPAAAAPRSAAAPRAAGAPRSPGAPPPSA